MKTVLVLLVLRGYFSHFYVFSTPETSPKTEQSLEEMIRETCLQKTGYKTLDDNNTFFRVEEVAQSSTVSLSCTYCGESTEDTPRLWLRRVRGVNSSVEEVKFDLGPDLKLNKLVTFPNHTLTIRNVSSNDTGLYFCKSLQEDETTEFKFSVDIVKPDVPVAKERDKPWVTHEKFEQDIILKTNERIYESKNAELDELLDKLKLKVVSEWDPWFPCDGCSGIRKRYAKCRIHSSLNRVKYPDIVEDNLIDLLKLLHQSEIISCHSQDLSSWFPFLFSLTSTVPNYLQVQRCFDSCTSADRQAHDPKHQMLVRLDVGSSMAFSCPESDLKSKVMWKRDGVTMKPVGMKRKKDKKKKIPFYRIPFQKKTEELKLERAFVDRMNVLQLCSVSFRESGFYVCYVDKVIMKSFNVSVVTAEETRRERFYHFLLLSVYTSLISAIIVFVGIAWAFLNRDSFVKINEH